jgi:hypothetical protein
MSMKSKKLLEVVRHTYDYVETALWALLIAVVIFFVVVVVPRLPEMAARYQTIRMQEIAAENEIYCAKLGMQRSTEKFSECLLVLGEFRSTIQKRIEDEQSF